jgi:hypothetical protein
MLLAVRVKHNSQMHDLLRITCSCHDEAIWAEMKQVNPPKVKAKAREFFGAEIHFRLKLGPFSSHTRQEPSKRAFRPVVTSSALEKL